MNDGYILSQDLVVGCCTYYVDAAVMCNAHPYRWLHLGSTMKLTARLLFLDRYGDTNGCLLQLDPCNIFVIGVLFSFVLPSCDFPVLWTNSLLLWHGSEDAKIKGRDLHLLSYSCTAGPFLVFSFSSSVANQRYVSGRLPALAHWWTATLFEASALQSVGVIGVKYVSHHLVAITCSND